MRSFPWDSIAISIGEDGLPVYDRSYQASDLREVYETFFSNGVFMPDGEPSFKVSPGEGMNVLVDPGKCHILGTVGYEHEQRELAITEATSSDRIDTVVLRWDINVDARDIDLYVLRGAPADVPTRPALTRSETVWELGLCDIFVPAYSLSVAADRITDTRLDNERCGVVTPFSTVDTTTFYDQLQAAVDKAVKESDDALAGSLPGQLSDYKVTEDGTLVLPDLGLSTEELPGGIVKAIDIAGAIYHLEQYGSVSAGQLAANAVTSAKIADGAVTSAKIADGTIATADLANGCVTSAKIADSTIATDDLANNAVTADKLASSSVQTAKIVDSAVTLAKLAANSVNSSKIVDGSIVNADIANGTIAFGKLDAAAQKRVTDLEAFRNSVTQGTSGIWRYRKLSDGSSECIGEQAFTVSVVNLYTSGLYFGNVTSPNFPSGVFNARPMVGVSIETADSTCWLAALTSSAATTGKPQDLRVISASQATVKLTVRYHAVGRWK